MSKHWVFTFRVEPPPNKTIMVRFGATILDATYFPVLDQWLWLQPGGIEEKISEPPMWFCDDEWAKTHQRDLSKGRRTGVRLREKTIQYELAI